MADAILRRCGPAARLGTPRTQIFTPVRTANAFEQTVERIGRAIKIGLLRPGERLPSERDLAEQLALSRSTVREALRVLAEAGYLEARRGRGGGMFVAAGAAEARGRATRDVLRARRRRLRDLLASAAAGDRRGRAGGRARERGQVAERPP